MCIMGRSFAIKQTVSWGFRVALMRDLVDTMYSPLDPPYVEHDLGNAIMTSFIVSRAMTAGIWVAFFQECQP